MKRLWLACLVTTALLIAGCTSVEPEASQVDISSPVDKQSEQQSEGSKDRTGSTRDDNSSNEDKDSQKPLDEAVGEAEQRSEKIDTPPPNWTQSASPSDTEKCRVPDPRPRSEQLLYRGQRVNGVLGRDPVGFTDWRREGLLPITQSMNIIFARIAFDDAPPSSSISDQYLEQQAKKMTELGHHWSQGTFTYEFQIVEDWVEVPANHADFPVSAGDDVDHSPEAYALAEKNIEIVSQLIVENLPADLDFNSADIVVPVWSTNITEFTMPVTWRGGGLRGPDGQRTNLIFMGNSTYMHDNLDYTWSVIAHDFLHLQGLNLHAPGPKFGTHIGGMTKPNYWGWSALVPAWETFLLNWFEDSQVHCITADDLGQTEQVILTPLESFGGERKAIVIPTVDYKALVVESRRPIGYSENWPAGNTGLLVYEVDTNTDHVDHGQNPCSNSRENPKWSFYLLPDGSKEAAECNNPEPYFLQPGETLTHAGVLIEFIHSAEEADYVQVAASGATALEPSGSASSPDFESNHLLDIAFVSTRKKSFTNHCSCCGCNPFEAN